MYDLWMMIFTGMSGIGACIAVIVAIIIYRRQKKIALLERRVQILNNFEHFVYDVLPNWEWDGSTSLVSRYSQDEIKVLFNQDYVKLQNDILNTAEECNILIGNIKQAQRIGECNGKNECEIEADKIAKESALQEVYKSKRSAAYKKWLMV